MQTPKRSELQGTPGYAHPLKRPKASVRCWSKLDSSPQVLSIYRKFKLLAVQWLDVEEKSGSRGSLTFWFWPPQYCCQGSLWLSYEFEFQLLSWNMKQQGYTYSIWKTTHIHTCSEKLLLWKTTCLQNGNTVKITNPKRKVYWNIYTTNFSVFLCPTKIYQLATPRDLEETFL